LPIQQALPIQAFLYYLAQAAYILAFYNFYLY
jgi:hypothetical protein